MNKKYNKLILLDRDGTINEMIINADHGTVDSPLHESQVKLIDGVPSALKQLNENGYMICIVTNQPAAAKNKSTKSNLIEVHEKILKLAQSEGAIIEWSAICYHRDEDGCNCRKPKTGLLEQIFEKYPGYDKKKTWMVGDGVTDVEAGKSFGLKTAFVGPKKCDYCKVFENKNLNPDFWSKTLPEFTKWICADENK